MGRKHLFTLLLLCLTGTKVVFFLFDLNELAQFKI